MCQMQIWIGSETSEETTNLTRGNMLEELVLKFSAKFQSNSPSSFGTVNHLFTKSYKLIPYNLRLTLQPAKIWENKRVSFKKKKRKK